MSQTVEMPEEIEYATDSIASEAKRIAELAKAAETLGLRDLALELRFICRDIQIDTDKIVDFYRRKDRS